MQRCVEKGKLSLMTMQVESQFGTRPTAQSAHAGARGPLIVTALVLLIGLGPLIYGDYARRAQRRRLDEQRRRSERGLVQQVHVASELPTIRYRTAQAVA